MSTRKHTVEVAKTKLDIDEGLDFHETGWKIQRVGWVCIFLFVFLAALGFFGQGIVSEEIITQGQTTISFEKYFRRDAKMELKIDLKNARDKVNVRIPGNYLSHFMIDKIQPEPTGNAVTEGSVNYTFNGSGDIQIVFFLWPQKTGSVKDDIAVNDDIITVSHFIYP